MLYAEDWGYHFDKEDVKSITKSYLDRAGNQLKPFKNNMPGDVWCTNFVERHSEVLKSRILNIHMLLCLEK